MIKVFLLLVVSMFLLGCVDKYNTPFCNGEVNTKIIVDNCKDDTNVFGSCSMIGEDYCSCIDDKNIIRNFGTVETKRDVSYCGDIMNSRAARIYKSVNWNDGIEKYFCDGNVSHNGNFSFCNDKPFFCNFATKKCGYITFNSMDFFGGLYANTALQQQTKAQTDLQQARDVNVYNAGIVAGANYALQQFEAALLAQVKTGVLVLDFNGTKVTLYEENYLKQLLAQTTKDANKQ